MKITKREILASITIIAVMFLIGNLISGKIESSQIEKNSEYYQATKITDSEMFQYGMNTDLGHAFVYGDLQAVDTVTFDEIGGEYLHVEKIKERYERHEREVTETDSKGQKHTKIEVYYEWETKDRESKHSEKIIFCGIEFPYSKIPYYSDNHIKTINSDREYSWESGEFVKVRFKYYGTSIKHTGTVYTDLRNGTMSDGSAFYVNQTIDEAVDYLTHTFTWVFWIIWILITGGVVFGFYYFDNTWLE